jgi:hypothetical protein
MYTYKAFVIKPDMYPNKQLICLYYSNSITLANSSIKSPLTTQNSSGWRFVFVFVFVWFNKDRGEVYEWRHNDEIGLSKNTK